MRILTVVGARPQFIKAAMVSYELRKNHTEIFVHTGQHYDYNMSDQFFEELNISKPDYNLGISGGTHAIMTGKMMISIEEVLVNEKPDMLLVYGDTNSTLAAALTAVKLHIPICHVEAGTRTHCNTNPEEINRICTDHVSSLLLVSTPSGLIELEREGLISKAYFVGDLMYDAFIKYSDCMNISSLSLKSIIGNDFVHVPEKYYYLTCHREENSNENSLREILHAMEGLGDYTIYPVHPRNKECAKKIIIRDNLRRIILTEPVGYIESVCLMNNCSGVVTDSGGLQREAFFAKKKCITVLDFVVWPETMIDNCNQLAKADAVDIQSKMYNKMIIKEKNNPFGDGLSAKKIVKYIEKYLNDSL